MTRFRTLRSAWVLLTASLTAIPIGASGQDAPRFEPDPYWPKHLPNSWILGQVSGTAVDSHDHIWVLHRPRTADATDTLLADGMADCCIPAPPVLEFDLAGNLLQAWGGPAQGVDWPDNEHGIFVDHADHVWITGNGEGDTNLLKFSASGEMLLEIGRRGAPGDSNDTENVNQAAGVAVYAPANEVFVADGYGNRRVIVFDADTGAYKRHWGAYGNRPDDAASRERVYEGAGPPQFNLVHGLGISNDGLVYVGDRVNSRIQVFAIDGTYIDEVFIQRHTTASFGTAYDVAFSVDDGQRYLYVPDGSNRKVHIVDRNALEVVGFFGGFGGHGLGEFTGVHSIAADSRGNLYLGEVRNGRRVSRWNYLGPVIR